MSKKIWLSLIIVAIASIGVYWLAQSKSSVTSITTDGRSFGEYKVHSTGNTGFCGDDEVLDNNDTHIVTLRLCEDNISKIERKRDWIIVSTDAGRSYKKNVTTGEEILNAEGGVGGMSVVK